MRFYEAHGQTTEAEIEISLNLLQAENIWECDLMENKNALLTIVKGTSNYLQVIFKPYEIKTFFWLHK
jgi:alpha-mannosidase